MSLSLRQGHLAAGLIRPGPGCAVYRVPGRGAVVVAQVLIYLDGDAAVLVGLGGRGQIAGILDAALLLVVGQGQIGQLLIALEPEGIGALRGDVGEVLGGAVLPLQGDGIAVTADRTG